MKATTCRRAAAPCLKHPRLFRRGGNPAGRLRGSRNRLSEAVICALLRDFDKHGEKAIARVREENPAMYLKVIAMVLPRQHKVEILFILLRAVLEGLPAVVILVPTFLPVVKKMNIDLIHYAIVVTAATGIGLFLPPIGVGLFISCGI